MWLEAVLVALGRQQVIPVREALGVVVMGSRAQQQALWLQWSTQAVAVAAVNPAVDQGLLVWS